MYKYSFGCNEVTICIESNSEELVEDLIELYGNYYKDDIKSPTFTIKYIENSKLIDDYELRDRENEDETFNYIKYDTKTSILNVDFENKYNKENKLDFMQRILINMFVLAFQKNGYSIIHGACISKDGNAFIISGDKGAGKTTTMLRMLENGYDFISNDKVAVKKMGDKVIVCGIPHSMGIIKEDIDKYKIKKEYGRVDGSKIYYRVAEISSAMGVNAINKAVLKSIIFPKYEKGRQFIETTRTSQNCRQLGRDNIFFNNAVSEQKRYLSDLVGYIEYDIPRYLDDVDGIKVTQGKDTFEQLSRYLNNIVHKQNEDCYDLCKQKQINKKLDKWQKEW